MSGVMMGFVLFVAACAVVFGCVQSLGGKDGGSAASGHGHGHH